MNSRELVRLWRLSDIYSRMSDEERRAYSQLMARNGGGVGHAAEPRGTLTGEMMGMTRGELGEMRGMTRGELGEMRGMLEGQGLLLEDLSRRVGRYPFAMDLLANVSGNVITSGLGWLVARMVK